MKRTNSFTAGMFATWGVLAAIAIAAAGFFYISKEMRRQQPVAGSFDKRAEDYARKLALKQLQPYGITALSDDTGLAKDGADIVLVGTGMDKDRRLKRLLVRFHVATFGQNTTWKILAINIEGEKVYESER